MYRIGIIGHAPENFSDVDATKRLVDQTLDLISYQYDEDLIMNLVCDIGVGDWSAEFCAEQGIRYHLFLQSPVEDMKDIWFDDQFNSLNRHFIYAWATTISFPRYESSEQMIDNYKHIIDNSNFVIYFWNKMKQGNMYESIKYALNKNVLSINGLDERKLITNEDI